MFGFIFYAMLLRIASSLVGKIDIIGKSSRYQRLSSLKLSNDGPPPTPKSFGKYFQLPKISSKLRLAELNKHKNDVYLKFEEKSHTYTYNNKKLTSSVTSVVDSYFGKFDPDSVIDKMKKKEWPRDDYTNNDGSVMTDDEIKTKWNAQGLYARNYGSWFHFNVELYLNDLEASPDVPEMEKYYLFEEQVMMPLEITPFRTEWRIAATKEGIAGTVDFVGRCPDGTFCIMDWKTTKGLANKFSNKFSKAKHPIDHLDDCDGEKYNLQLNIYKYILEKYYGIKISKMVLAAFNKAEPGYFTKDVEDMQDSVQAIMDDFVQQQDSVVDASPKESARIPF